MSSTYGHNIHLSVFGQSHSEKIGVVIDGLPAGFEPDMDRLAAFCARRTAIGKSGVTARKEADTPQIVSGLFEGKTCGAPLAALIDNTDIRSQDYQKLKSHPRPSHADFCAEIKHAGFQDFRGGGHFSGRLTAPLVFAGGLLMQLLAKRGIRIGARVKSIGTVRDVPLDPAKVDEATLDAFSQGDFPCLGDPAAMQAEIAKAAADADSVGGTVECCILGLPTGLGEPMFDSLESRISSALFSVPAVKGIAFGDGFALSEMRGSMANDPFYYDSDGKVRTKTNRNGGILGGLSTGMPLVFTAALKPTPSIGKPQETVDLNTKTNASLQIGGRHDPCVVVRAVPCVESAAAIAIADLIL